MKDLIKIEEKDGKRLVDARELWKGLESRKDFSSWVKAKVIGNVFFEENVDYVLLTRSGEQKGRGGRNKKDYALTLDTAKKVAMAEQTEKGNVVRDYFLACEKKVKALSLPDFTDPAKAAIAWAKEYEEKKLALEDNKQLQIENEQLNDYVEEVSPMISYLDSILASTKSLTVTKIAADYDLTAQELNKILHKAELQYLSDGKWILYKAHKNKGYTTTEHKRIKHRDYVEMKPYTAWTQRGRVIINDILVGMGYISINDKARGK